MQEIKSSVNYLLVISVLVFFSTANAVTVRNYVTCTTTTTVTITSKNVCAKLVNVTGECRRRRDFQFEQPEILTFDDDIEESVDNTLQNLDNHNKFTATKTLSVEITPLVKLPSSVSASSIPGSIYNHFVQSSLGRTRTVSPHRQIIGNPKKRIFFSAFNKFSRFPTETYTTTKTETTTTMKRTDASFFVALCTPSPFPFKVCKGKR